MLLHGITSNAQAWWRVAPRLVGLGFRVVAFDMPGHGHSLKWRTIASKASRS